MRADKSRMVTDFYMGNEEVVIHTPRHEEAGPWATVKIDRFGIVTYTCEYRSIEICACDPGPGGISIHVIGKHEEGYP